MPAKKILLIASIFLVVGLVAVPVVLAGYGEAGVAPTCTAEKPSKPWLYYSEFLGNGQVKIVWDKNDRASSWTIAYGAESGKYIWGIDRFGNGELRSFTVSSLPAGTYYFVVRGNNGCMPGPFSNEVKVAAGAAKVAYTGTGVAKTTVPVVTEPETTKPRVTLTPTRTVQPRVTTAPRGGTETTRPVVPQPTPTPAKKGFFQGIIDFFLGLFK